MVIDLVSYQFQFVPLNCLSQYTPPFSSFSNNAYSIKYVNITTFPYMYVACVSFVHLKRSET